jgi:translation initiation factor IF-2
MGKTRVYELAKELNLSSKDIIDALQELGVDVKNHMSTINDDTVEVLKSIFTPEEELNVKNVKDKQKGKKEKMAVDEEEEENFTENERIIASNRGGKKKKKSPKKSWKGNSQEGAKENHSREEKTITLGERVTVKDLAEKMGIRASDVIVKLMGLGMMVNLNQEIDRDTAEIIADDYGFKVVDLFIKSSDEDVQSFDVDDEDLAEDDKPEDLVERPPIVTVMGHVDHGKTSLLDAIRKTNVISTEAGGITQHIGAYQVEKKGKKITFIDTPGHEAFTAMRARGAKVTDIAILVVAADDGVMPQTIEAINHARAANVPIIVAVNKMDKENANPQRVLQQLAEQGLVPEDWGGDTVCVFVSAVKKEGIDDLLEMILLISEMSEFKANPKRLASGTVIEAKLDKGRGPVATVLVQNGTLHVGDPIVCGTVSGKVRAMMNDRGERVKSAGPSTPIEVLGFNDVPQAGDIMKVYVAEKKAKQVAETRLEERRQVELNKTARITLDDLFLQIKEGSIKELNIVIKADVQGSVEAIKQSLERLGNEEVRVNVIHGGVGAITETDIMLASASNAIVIGFNVRPDGNARRLAETEKIDVRSYRVIYEAIDDIKAAMEGLLEPDYKEVIIGHAQVRATFKVPKVGVIAGCYVTEGKVTRNAKVRVVRNGVVVAEGSIDSLKRFKDDVKEVVSGYECGIGIENFNDVKEGDVIEAYTFEEVKKHL